MPLHQDQNDCHNFSVYLTLPKARTHTMKLWMQGSHSNLTKYSYLLRFNNMSHAKQRPAFRGNGSPTSSRTKLPIPRGQPDLRRGHYNPPKPQEPLIQRHSITFQKTRILIK